MERKDINRWLVLIIEEADEAAVEAEAEAVEIGDIEEDPLQEALPARAALDIETEREEARESHPRDLDLDLLLILKEAEMIHREERDLRLKIQMKKNK